MHLTERLTPLIKKKDTKYCFAIPVGIRVACSLFKLAHGADYLQCSEMFAIGKSTVHLVLHEFVCAVNEVFKSQIRWPEGEDLTDIMNFCGLPSIHGAIDAAQIHIVKPKGPYAADYFSYKSKGHSLQLQAMVDHQKKFREINVGMPGFMNDSRILRRSTLYHKVGHGGLFNMERGSQEGIRPYLIGDKGYPLLPWLMIPHKNLANFQHIVLQSLFNKHLCRGRSVAKNAFGILKQTFRELLLKTNLSILFLPDVVACCCMLHNTILDGKDVDVMALLAQLDLENGVQQDTIVVEQGSSVVKEEPTLESVELSGVHQIQVLEVFLGNRRPRRI